MTTGRATRRRVRDTLQREDLPSGRHMLGVGIIGGIGAGTLLIHLLHLLSRSESTIALLLGALLPMGLSAFVLSVGVWIHTRHVDKAVIRIGNWCLAGTVVLVGTSVVSIAYQNAKGVLMAELPFVVVNHATVGAALGVIMGIYDSQRARKEREARNERERARRLGNRLTVLNRVLRHDIRNSINVIQGNAELLLAGTAEPTSVARTINRKIDELKDVSDQARQLERLLDRNAITRRTVDIGDVLRAKALRYRNEHPDVTIETQVPESVRIRAVPLITDAIEELLENAIEHNDAATPRITVDVTTPSSRSTGDDDPGTAIVRIRDNGPGVPESEIEVLERGYETDLEHLSGLGLWFVYWTVERSGGEINFERDTSRGSLIEVCLPLARSNPGRE